MQITYFKLVAVLKAQNFTCNDYNASKSKLHNVFVTSQLYHVVEFNLYDMYIIKFFDE